MSSVRTRRGESVCTLESCLKLGYTGAFLGAQLDLTTRGAEEHITFSVSYVAEVETEIIRVAVATRAVPALTPSTLTLQEKNNLFDNEEDS